MPQAAREFGSIGFRLGIYDCLVPIYEFECGSCGARFEQLVSMGTEAATCPACEAEGASRAYSSPQAPAFRLVKTQGEMRKQERRNAALQASAKARFKEARRRARQRAGGTGGDGSQR